MHHQAWQEEEENRGPASWDNEPSFLQHKTVKLAGWSDKIEQKIIAKREEQLDLFRQRQGLEIFNHVTFQLMPFLVTSLSFLFFLLQGNSLSPSIVFTVMSVFWIMKHPLNELPGQIIFFIDYFISVGRIEEFLEQDDIEEDIVGK